MNNNIKAIFIAIFLFSILILTSSQTNQTSIKIATTGLQFLNLDTNQTQKFYIDYLNNNDKSVILTALPYKQNSLGTIQFYFSTSNTNNTNPNENISDFQCLLEQHYNSCLINQNKISLKTINIQAKCLHGPCFVNLKLSFQRELIFNGANFLTIQFNDSPYKLLKFTIPQQYQRLILDFQFKNKGENKPNDTTIQVFNAKPNKLEFFGDNILAAFVYINSSKSCSNCDVYVVINSEKKSYVNVSISTYQSIQEVSLNTEYTDYLRRVNYYKITLPLDLNYDYVKISMQYLKETASDLKIMVNDGKSPSKTDYKWLSKFSEYISEDDEDEDDSTLDDENQYEENVVYSLTITKDQINNLNLTINTFFICFQGAHPGGYDFEVVTGLNQLNRLTLENNEIISAKLNYGEVINLFHLVPFSDEISLKVKLTLRSLTGNADVYVNQCTDTNCNNIYDNFLIQPDSRFKAVSIAKSETTDFAENVQFDAHCTTPLTIDENFTFCGFIIGVYGKSQENETTFLIEIDKQRREHIQIIENTPFRNMITKGDSQFYIFYLNNQSDVQQIQFRVTSPYVQMYVSMNEKCEYPDAGCASLRGIDISPISIRKINAKKAAYFIGIIGYAHTIYTVTADITRDGQDKIVRLSDAVPFQCEVNQINYVGYFAYQANNLSDEDDIEINLKAPFDKIMILVNNNGVLPDPESTTGSGYQWKSQSNVLIIKHNNKKFKKDGLYYIAIVAKDSAFTSINPNDESNSNDSTNNSTKINIKFEILVTKTSSIKLLQFNQEFYDEIQPKNDKMYEIIIDPYRNFIFFTKSLKNFLEYADKLTFYLGDEPFTDPSKYDVYITGDQNTSIKLNNTILQKLCANDLNEYNKYLEEINKQQDNNNQTADNDNSTQSDGEQDILKPTCVIYIAVENNSTKQISYTLNVIERDYAQELKDGIQYEHKLTNIDLFQYFYFHPTKLDPININVFSLYGKTTLQYTIWKMNNTPINTWPYPTDEIQYDYGSQIQNFHNYRIQTQQLENCWPKCIILMSVSYIIDNKYNESQAILENNDYIISCTTVYQQIIPGKHIQFNLENQQIKFFLLDLRDIIQKKINIIILTTQLQGMCGLTASVRDNLNERYPNHYSDYDFISYGNQMEITIKNILKVMDDNKLSAFQNPTLVIEAFSYESTGNFLISVITSDNPLIDLFQGIPQEFQVQKYKSQVFKFYNYNDESIKIKITKEMGQQGQISVLNCQNSNDYEDCIKEDPQIQQDLSQTFGTTIEVLKYSKIFCNYCYYLINITSNSDDIHGYINIQSKYDLTQLQEGKQLIDSLPPMNQSIYKLSVPKMEQCEITLTNYGTDIQVYANFGYLENQSKFLFGPYSLQQFINIKLPSYNEYYNISQDNLPQDQGSSNDSIVDDKVSFLQYYQQTEVYVLVINTNTKQSANYTIGYTAGELVKFLYEGQIMASSINPQNRTTFIYKRAQSSLEPVFTLDIDNDDAKISDLKIQVQQISFDQLGKLFNLNISYQPIQLEQFIRDDQSTSYTFPTDLFGQFQINITNNAKKVINFTASINSNQINLIPLRKTIQHYILQNSSNLYQIAIQQDGYLALHLQHCSGHIEIGYQQSYQSFIDQDYLNTAVSVPGHNYVDAIKVKRGVFFISLSSGDQEDAYFHIYADLFKKQSQIPQLKIEAGNNGNIQYQVKDNDKVILTFQTLKCKKCDSQDMQQARVIYEILWATDEELLNVLGKCNVAQYFDHSKKMIFRSKIQNNSTSKKIKTKIYNLTFDQEQQIKFEIQIEDFVQSTAVYFASVRATVSNFPNMTDDLYIFYDNIELRPETTQGEQFSKYMDWQSADALMWIILFSGMILLIILLVLTISICRRYRKAKQGKLYDSTASTDLTDLSDINIDKDQQLKSEEVEQKQKGKSNKNNPIQPYSTLNEDAH